MNSGPKVRLKNGAPFGPLMAWKRGDLLGVAQRLMGAFALALVGVGATFAVMGVKSVLAPFMIGLAVYVMAGALTDIVERTSLFRAPFTASVSRARGLPRSAWGTALAHFGLGVTLLGIVSETNWSSERIVVVKPNDVVSINSYDLTFQDLTQRQGPNYRELTARFTVKSGGDEIGVLEPSKRTFATRAMSTTEAALLTRGVSQLYLSLGDLNADGSMAIRLYHKPLVLLIWLGAVVMMLGGLLSLSDRRLRVGAPKPGAPKPARAALQPAE